MDSKKTLIHSGTKLIANEVFVIKTLAKNNSVLVYVLNNKVLKILEDLFKNETLQGAVVFIDAVAIINKEPDVFRMYLKSFKEVLSFKNVLVEYIKDIVTDLRETENYMSLEVSIDTFCDDIRNMLTYRKGEKQVLCSITYNGVLNNLPEKLRDSYAIG